MKIQIRSRDIEVSEILRTHVERRLGLALGRFAERIGRVTVRLSDAGQLQSATRCHIEVGLRPSGSVWAEDTNADLIAGVDNATDRVSRSVGLTLQRTESRPRKWV
jgi:ribosomal subunit interface protein